MAHDHTKHTHWDPDPFNPDVTFYFRALFGYDGMSNDLKFIGKGDGGLTELIDDFNSGKIQYAFLKVDLPNGSISKYVLINWQVCLLIRR